MLASLKPIRSSAADGRRRSAASSVGGALLCLALATTTAPDAAASSPGAARAGATTEFRFNFNNGESLNPGTRVVDVTGNGNRGTVVVSGGAQLKRVKGVTGAAAKFPRKCRGCGRALIEVSDERSLRPQRLPFSFGAAVKVTDGQARPHKDPNIVQKGYINGEGGQWKLELVTSMPRCVIAGRRGEVKAASMIHIDDGRWHNLECRRVGNLVTLRIDGKVAARAEGRIGRVTTSAPVRIGGKSVGKASDNDQYHGTLDNVYLKINRR